MNAIGFTCRECGRSILVDSMFIEKTDQKIYLLATCHECKTTFHYWVDNLIAGLYDTALVRSPKGVQ